MISSFTMLISEGKPETRRRRNEITLPTYSFLTPKNFEGATKYHVSAVVRASRPLIYPVSPEKYVGKVPTASPVNNHPSVLETKLLD